MYPFLGSIWGHSLTPGLSLTIFELNQKYYIGTFLFGLIKIIQLFYDQIKISFTFLNDGIINLYFLKENVPTIALLFFCKNIFLKFKNNILLTNERILVISMIAFFSLLISYPVIHQRYMFPIITTLLLIGINKSPLRLVPNQYLVN